MSPENFVYWLQGYMELSNPDNLALEQVQVIRDHLNLVFDKQTPERKIDLEKLFERTPKKKDLSSQNDYNPFAASANHTAEEIEGLFQGVLTALSC